jgi:hypothetical protein
VAPFSALPGRCRLRGEKNGGILAEDDEEANLSQDEEYLACGTI